TFGGRDLTGVARIDVGTGKLNWVATPGHEVDAVVPSPKGRWLAWTVNAGGRTELHLRDLKTGHSHNAGLPLGVASGLAFAPDDSRLAFVFSGPRANPDVWLWELPADKSAAKRALRQLTFSSRAGIPFTTFPEPELIHYKTFDGRKIPAWFYPAKGKAG